MRPADDNPKAPTVSNLDGTDMTLTRAAQPLDPVDEPLANLTAALLGRGFTVRKQRHGSLVVRNPAGEPAQDNPRGRLLSPGLRQE